MGCQFHMSIYEILHIISKLKLNWHISNWHPYNFSILKGITAEDASVFYFEF